MGGEGKSLFLKALFKIFAGKGTVFSSPKRGGLPLLDLPSAKVAFLVEYRFDPDVIDHATMCSWFDGSVVTITRPQNVAGAIGHDNYKGPNFHHNQARRLGVVKATWKHQPQHWQSVRRGCIDGVSPFKGASLHVSRAQGEPVFFLWALLRPACDSPVARLGSTPGIRSLNFYRGLVQWKR